ncbi:MAG: tRNA (adenosine(37)-N6)-dimethylallyltransferase MiaA [Candidatus Limnocylindrales bacterium]
MTPAGPPAGVTMSTTNRPPLIVIAGATATGKTELAIRVAEALIAEGRPATVISADSRQVYRGLDIGTAKVGSADRARVPHAGLDLADPPDRFTASAFVAHVDAVLADLGARDGVAILAGGTGLYLRAVARGLPLGDLPNDPAVRARLEDDVDRDGLEPMVARLHDVAPILAGTTHLANPRRVIRAMEIAELRGDGPRPAPRGYGGEVAWLGLEVEPEAHAAWITARAVRQFADGLVTEAVNLRVRHDPTLPCFSAIGYREAWSVADGARTVDQAASVSAARTIAFAKRQGTWFRSEPDIDWMDVTTKDPLSTSLEVVRRLVG